MDGVITLPGEVFPNVEGRKNKVRTAHNAMEFDQHRTFRIAVAEDATLRGLGDIAWPDMTNEGGASPSRRAALGPAG